MSEGSNQSKSGSSSPIFSKMLLVSGLSVLGAMAAYHFYRRYDSRRRAANDKRDADFEVATTVEDPTQISSSIFSDISSPVQSVQSSLPPSPCAAVKTPRKVLFLEPNEKKMRDLPNVRLPANQDDLQYKGVEAPIVAAQEFSSSPSVFSSLFSPLPSVCDCRESHESTKILNDDEALFDENLRFQGQLTAINPFNFQKYEPSNLLIRDEAEAANGLSPEARELEKPTEETLFTAFNPVLQSVVYASKHSIIIHELLDEYSYLASFKE